MARIHSMLTVTFFCGKLGNICSYKADGFCVVSGEARASQLPSKIEGEADTARVLPHQLGN